MIDPELRRRLDLGRKTVVVIDESRFGLKLGCRHLPDLWHRGSSAIEDDRN